MASTSTANQPGPNPNNSLARVQGATPYGPATNLIPIRRLALKAGESAAVQAAWVRFPEFSLELLEQSYARLDDDTYRYESGGGKFRRDLKVDASGLVLDYPELWSAESHTVDKSK